MEKLAEEKVFKDPVHKYIYVQDKLIWDLINTKEVQRLRRIRQLGTSYLTFHGAEHSRFSHSLGVYEVARKIISQFERNRYEDWPKEERLLCLCAALLHDVGHGPFSHSVEEAFQVRHEEWSRRLITGDTEIRSVLSRVSPDFPERVASVIGKTYEGKLAVSLISSQLDADRMDYLLRDAYFTGVNYGMFDLERILRVMRPHRGHIVVKDSGMHAVEDYLMSRYQMYWQVYFHPVTRGSEILLRNILRRASMLYRNGYRFEFLVPPLPAWFENRLDVRDFLLLDESLVQTVLARWADERDKVLSDLSARFIHRRLFKYAVLSDGETFDAEYARRQVADAGYDPDYYLEVDLIGKLPYDVYRPGNTGENIPILLLDRHGRLSEISTRSQIVRSLGDSAVPGGAHVYFPGDVPGLERLWKGDHHAV